MAIQAHRNLSGEALGRSDPGLVAAGSSNSNSHNSGGGGGSEISTEETRQILSQLADLLPRLERATGKGDS